MKLKGAVCNLFADMYEAC